MNRIDRSLLRASQVTQANLPKTAAARYRDREAVFCSMTGRRFSFREVNERMDRLANALISQGVKKGDHCAFQCRNRAEAGEIYGALTKIGAVALPLQWGFGPDQIVEYLGFVGARVFLFEDIYAATAAEIKKALPDVKTFIRIGNVDTGFALPYEELIAGSSAILPLIEVDSGDIQCIDTTSRTTGPRKVFPLTHGNGLFGLGFFTTAHDLTTEDIILTVFPLYGRGGLVWYGAGFLVGARNVFFQPDLTDPAGILRIIQEQRITITNWSPVFASLILKIPDLNRYDLSSLRGISFSNSPFPVALQHEVMERICPNIYEFYGMHEAGIIAHMGPDQKRRNPAPVGTRCFGTELRVVDKDGKDVPAGEIGQIVCRGISITPGYFKDEPRNRESFRDGWFYTGDWGRLDEEDFLYFMGRREDMIVSGGRTVFALTVEEVLASCEGVLDVAVIGLPDDTLGEAVVAVVVRNPKRDVTDRLLLDWCRERLLPHQVPGRVIFTAMLPRNNVGKVTKHVMVEKYSREKFRDPDGMPGEIT
jgi:fatty-acyl-CoA synthase